MGDIRVISAAEQDVLHKLDNGGMRFKVKVPFPGLGPALTFTARQDPYKELYKIIFGHEIKLLDMITEEQVLYPLPINLEEYQEFWIMWYNKKLRMGIVQERKPFLVYNVKTEHQIGYAQFNTLTNNWAPIEWIIETSPVIFKPLPTKKFQDQLRWCEMENGQLPPGAMIGGFEDEPIYIARAKHNNSLCPGKYVPSKGLAYVPWGRLEHVKREFEILCGYNAMWVKTKLNYIPTNAFVGGRSEVPHDPLYIGRTMHEGHLIPGKVHVRYKNCYVPYNGKEIEFTSYEILVIPDEFVEQALPFLQKVN